MSNLYSQRIDPFILNKAAKKPDYTLGLYYCEMFETLLEICSKTPYKIENSNLLIAAFDGLSDWVNNTKTIFIDQKLEELFREIFVCINEINRYTSSTSSPNLPFVNIPFPHMNEISVCFNNYCGAYDSVLGVNNGHAILFSKDQDYKANKPEEDGELEFSAVYLDIDEESGKANSIKRILITPDKKEIKLYD